MNGQSETLLAASDGGPEASEVPTQRSLETPSDQIVSFRVHCESDDAPGMPSAAHLPLKRVHDRFGDAPLKQLLASCASLAK
jgi:hypothetical protein